MQGADQHIRGSLGFSILPKDTSTSRAGELNQWPSTNKTLALTPEPRPVKTNQRKTDKLQTNWGGHTIWTSAFSWFIDNNLNISLFQVDWIYEKGNHVLPLPNLLQRSKLQTSKVSVINSPLKPRLQAILWNTAQPRCSSWVSCLPAQKWKKKQV